MWKSIRELCGPKQRNFPAVYVKMPALMHDIATSCKKATFGLGCFWAAESVFGAQLGVLRTRVGYADGTTPYPTYRKIGDYTEVVEIDYDPKTISYDKLLDIFWKNHEYGITKKQKKQYTSLILYHNEEQKKIAESSKQCMSKINKDPIQTEIKPFRVFYAAEDYHQKYYLQEHATLINQMCLTPVQLQTSHVATRLNGYVTGVGGCEQFESEWECLGLTREMADYVRKLLVKNKGGNLTCGS